MVARTETYEYTRFGDAIMRRPADSAEPWQDCTGDVEAEIAVRTAEALRARPSRGRGVTLRITRAPVNIEVAARLGLTADQLAERLARPDDNRGTTVRVSDDNFDGLMQMIGLDPNEARDRLSGRYWQPPGPGDKSTAKAAGVS